MECLPFGLMQVDGMGYTEAVKILCEQKPVYVPRAEPAPKKKPFALPLPNDSFYRVRRYLNQGESGMRYWIALCAAPESCMRAPPINSNSKSN